MTKQNNNLQGAERLDELLIDGLQIIQHPDEFRFTLDAVLLAQFATVKPGGSVVDLGTGTGVIAMLLAARGSGRIEGLEINPRLADMAGRSVQWNGLEDRITIRQGDMRQLRGLLPAGEWELVVCNPPYRVVGSGFASPNQDRARACHEVDAGLADVVQAARYLVKYRGRVAFCQLPERAVDVLAAMRSADIEPKRLRWVHPRLDRPPSLVLVEGIRGAKPGLEVLPPLVVYDGQGNYTDEILGYYDQSGQKERRQHG